MEENKQLQLLDVLGIPFNFTPVSPHVTEFLAFNCFLNLNFPPGVLNLLYKLDLV